MVISETKLRRPFLLAIGAILIFATIILSQFPSTNKRLDTCYIRREIESPARTIIPLQDGALHDYSVVIMWFSMFVLALLPEGRRNAFFSLLYGSLWFHATYILLAALKAPLQDYNCAGRHTFFPNGISGHYCYFIFVALTAPRFAQARLKANPAASTFVIYFVTFLLTVFGIGAVATLHRTFFHGYHSVRQIMLGAALGIYSHVALDGVLFEERRDMSVRMLLAVLFSNSLTSLTLYFQLWPHEEAGDAISSGQLKFHATLWLLLVAATALLPAKRMEVKQA